MVDVDTVAAAVEPVVAALGLELYDVEVLGSPRARTVRVAVDAPGGVDLDTVATLSQALSPVLDADPGVQSHSRGPYTLEVTSPGLERRLRTPAHFQRALGSTVSVKTTSGGRGLRRQGTLLSADNDGIQVQFDTGEERLAYDAVAQARTVFEWGPAAKPGSRPSREGSSR
jgi:ribosome maturation factor RimP